MDPASDRSIVALDTETTGGDLHHGCLPFFVSTDNGDTNDPRRLKFWEWDVDPTNRIPSIPEEDLEQLRDYLRDKTVILHNSKFDIRALHRIGIKLWELCGWENIHDTMIASHAISNSSRRGLKELCVRHLSILDDDEFQLNQITNRARAYGRKMEWDIARPRHPHFPALRRFGQRNSGWKMDMWLPRACAKYHASSGLDTSAFPGGEKGITLWESVLREYALTDAYRTVELWKKLSEKLHSMNLWKQYHLNQRLIEVVYEMEERGLHVSERKLKAERMRFAKSAVTHATRAQAICGNPEANLNSKPVLIKILHEDFGLPVLSRTEKAELPKTGIDDLIALLEHTQTPRQKRFILDLILSRKFHKAIEYLETYCWSILGSSIHSDFDITGTTVTRMSSREPNMQNVGKGGMAKDHWPESLIHAINEAGLNLRRSFCPPPGREWYAIDFQQLHPRIFAWLSGDQEAQDTFNSGKDYYKFLARGMFGLDTEDDVTSEQRKWGKITNLADLYGSGEATLNTTTGIPGLKQKLADAFPHRQEFIEKLEEKSRGHGFVETTLGYRLYCPDQHKLVNYRIIGDEGLLAKEAMWKCHQYLKEIRTPLFDPFLIAQIHDEILFSFPRDNRERNLEHVKELCRLMESCGDSIGVRTPVEANLIAENSSWATPEKVKW